MSHNIGYSESDIGTVKYTSPYYHSFCPNRSKISVYLGTIYILNPKEMMRREGEGRCWYFLVKDTC
jgi:hypothetical protein